MASLVVNSKVKELIKKNGMNCAGSLPDDLDKVVEALIVRAAERAKSNDRKTVRGGDL